MGRSQIGRKEERAAKGAADSEDTSEGRAAMGHGGGGQWWPDVSFCEKDGSDKDDDNDSGSEGAEVGGVGGR
ncbi:UNVERIFIED_CONTAM: hypothetical protein Sradi_3846400 [Sesamum radiatum]|uniref:Uncharacterized protein n=1 Tax=Sesamum radiatum TaxID=300843 RepID=A0AAW2Q1D7_SESRA